MSSGKTSSGSSSGGGGLILRCVHRELRAPSVPKNMGKNIVVERLN